MQTYINLTYDTLTQSITDGNTTSEAYNWAPTAFYGNNLTLCAEISTNTVGEDLTDLITWRFGLGNLSSTQNPLVESDNADFNTIAWSDPATGKISVLVNTTSTTLATDLGTKSGKRYYAEISGTSNTTGDIITVAVFPFNINNTIFKDV